MIAVAPTSVFTFQSTWKKDARVTHNTSADILLARIGDCGLGSKPS